MKGQVSAEAAHSGRSGFKVKIDSKQKVERKGLLAQTVKVPAGHAVVVTAWSKLDGGIGACGCGIQIRDTKSRQGNMLSAPYDVGALFNPGLKLLNWYRISAVAPCPSGEAEIGLYTFENGHQELIDGAFDDIEITSFPLARGVPFDATTFGNRSYKLFKTCANHDMAERLCEKMGGRLVTVTANQQHLFLKNTLAKNAQGVVWLGLERKAGKLVWNTGEPLGFNKIPSNAKEEKEWLIAWDVRADNWRYYSGGHPAWFICEWDAQSLAAPPPK
jgi:hypothetical protein